MLAAQASDRLGPGGMLTPEDRDVLVRRAGLLGLGAFDAHLVIAIVQDAGRRGEPGLSGASAERLAMVGNAGREGVARSGPRSVSGLARSTVWVLLVSTVLFWLMVYWLTGAFSL